MVRRRIFDIILRRADGKEMPRDGIMQPEELFIMHDAVTDGHRRDSLSYTQYDVPRDISQDPAFMADAKSRGYTVSARPCWSYARSCR